eukprot:515167-Rhodomonas_salina.2
MLVQFNKNLMGMTNAEALSVPPLPPQQVCSTPSFPCHVRCWSQHPLWCVLPGGNDVWFATALAMWCRQSLTHLGLAINDLSLTVNDKRRTLNDIDLTVKDVRLTIKGMGLAINRMRPNITDVA